MVPICGYRFGTHFWVPFWYPFLAEIAAKFASQLGPEPVSNPPLAEEMRVWSEACGNQTASAGVTFARI